jgi:hypothetical protein
MTSDVQVLREAFARFDPASAHEARVPPRVDEIYTPPGHAAVLDPERSLVEGGRGMGKSFWSGALVDGQTRQLLDASYPHRGLSDCDVRLGFAAGDMGPDSPPSEEVLDQLTVVDGFSPELVWRAVLWRYALETTGLSAPSTWRETLAKCAQDAERVQLDLHNADLALRARHRRLLVVFDALDRLGSDWDTIRKRSQALLRLTLAVRQYRAIKVKVFIRSDQYADDALFSFPDASKLKAAAVALEWTRRDLYGLAFRRLQADSAAAACFIRFVGRFGSGDLPGLGESEDAQQKIFVAMAGPHMGRGPRRGKTYPWLHNHLGDALGRVSPRSFLIALRHAAEHRPAPEERIFDPKGLEAGVRAASETRVEQLAEEYRWVKLALAPLADLRVPCDAEEFGLRWRQAGTTDQLLRAVVDQHYLGPIEMTHKVGSDEDALLEALRRIAVVERRPDGRINIPDIFRIAAKLLKRGGVSPRR